MAKKPATKKKSTKQPPRVKATLTENRSGEVVTQITRLAVLELGEVATINRGIQAIERAVDTLRLVQAGQNATWDALRAKYELPEEFLYNPVDGVITPQDDGDEG